MPVASTRSVPINPTIKYSNRKNNIHTFSSLILLLGLCCMHFFALSVSILYFPHICRASVMLVPSYYILFYFIWLLSDNSYDRLLVRFLIEDVQRIVWWWCRAAWSRVSRHVVILYRDIQYRIIISDLLEDIRDRISSYSWLVKIVVVRVWLIWNWIDVYVITYHTSWYDVECVVWKY